MKVYTHVDEAYLDLVEYVLHNGIEKNDRTETGTRSVFGYHYKLQLNEYTWPLLTTKRLPWHSIIAENIWFLSGDPHIDKLKDWGIKFWDPWADGNQLETAYGRYWRYFPDVHNTPVRTELDSVLNVGERFGTLASKYFHFHPEEPHISGFDQISWIMDQLRDNPDSRRMVLTAWHPQNAIYSKLPACHYSAVFNVQDGKLSCHLTQRSGDIALGIPFNIAGYAFLTKLMAQYTGLDVGEFSHTIVDAHIYSNHVDGLKEQLSRRKHIREEPRLLLVNPRESIFDHHPSDFALINYQPLDTIRFEVAV